MTTRAAEWAERVRAWRESGQTPSEFAQGKDFSEKNLRWWAGELARRSRPEPTVRMARVVRRRERSEIALTIAVGSASIGVRPGFDPELLREVVRALTAAR